MFKKSLQKAVDQARRSGRPAETIDGATGRSRIRAEQGQEPYMDTPSMVRSRKNVEPDEDTAVYGAPRPQNG